MKYFGYPHSIEEEKNLNVVKEPPVFKKTNNDEVYKLIFAPDPVTGWPCSSLGVYVKSQNSEVRDYIKQHFLVDKGTGYDGYSDPDLALDGVKTSHETKDEYFARLFEAAEREQAKLDATKK